MTMVRRPPHVGAVVLFAIIAGVTGLGCGGSDTDTAEGPNDAGSEPVAAALRDIPRPVRSEPFGAASANGDVVAQSFQVTGVTAEAVIEFFDERLTADGWVRTTPVDREPGPGRADFVRDDRRLEVSAIAVTTEEAPGAEQANVQFSLLLRGE